MCFSVNRFCAVFRCGLLSDLHLTRFSLIFFAILPILTPATPDLIVSKRVNAEVGISEPLTAVFQNRPVTGAVGNDRFEQNDELALHGLPLLLLGAAGSCCCCCNRSGCICFKSIYPASTINILHNKLDDRSGFWP